MDEYDTDTFCDLFTNAFNLEIDDSLTEFEMRKFKELMDVTCRFSPYEEDLNIPNLYYTEQQVRYKAEEISRYLIIKNPET